MADYHYPPGPRPRPIFGNLREFRPDQLGFMTNLARTYGDAATMYIFKRPIVFFTRPEAIRYVLIENARNFINRPVFESLRLVLGDGLLSIDGDFHRQQRRMVQPAFHKQRVESYCETMVACTESMLDTWTPGSQRDIADEMMRVTMRIVAKALFNIDIASQIEALSQAFSEASDYSRRARAPWSLRINLPFTSYGKYLRARKYLDDTMAGLIAQHRASGEDSGDVISMLLQAQDEDGSAMPDQQVRDETLTLLAAGHATTANTLSWAFYLLSTHPEQRDKLLDELRGVLGGRPPTVDDLANLPYLDMVVKETMRLYPPAWMQPRYAVDDFEYGGYRIKRGTVIFLSQWVTHRLPDLWPEPDAFKPERFDPETGQKYPAQAYFPFGAGSRICIGMPFANLEARILLATILQRYVPRMKPGFPVVPQPMVTLFPKFGLQMILEPAAKVEAVQPA
ncbi:MAG TPA: cytochrome P450 [Ktedonobacterales bacterium]|nr:cytochrome P450 [Ktedonobacterales bacterium]